MVFGQTCPGTWKQGFNGKTKSNEHKIPYISRTKKELFISDPPYLGLGWNSGLH